MPINPEVEAPLRELLDYALHGRLDDAARLMTHMGDQAYSEALVLCVTACGYIVSDVAKRWPQEIDIREAAQTASEARTSVPVSEDEMYVFLLRSVFGFEPLDQVFTDKGKLATVPPFTLARLLLSFFRPGEHWSDYLSAVWNAIEAAEKTSLSVLPALAYRHHALSARSGNPVRPSAS